MARKISYVASIVLLAISIAGCGEKAELCKERDDAIRMTAEAISKVAKGTATQSELAEGRVAAQRMSTVAGKLSAKGITCN